MNIRIFATALTFATMLVANTAMAEGWPRGTTRIVVPFAAGSTPDGLGRLLAERLQARFGTPFVVENKAGASGNTGTDAVAKAAPDGATVGLSIVGPLVLNRLLFKTMPYDTARDLAAITIVAEQPSILVVSNDSGLFTLGDLLARLKRDGATLNYGSIGYGSLSHLAMVAIVSRADADPQHIAYTSSPAIVTALARNDVQMAVLPAGSVVPQGRGGLLKLLAATGTARSELVSDVPTLRESGIDGVDAAAWVGLIAPADVPLAVQSDIRAAVLGVLKEPGMRERLAALFLEPVGGTSDEFRNVMNGELARWKPIIEAKSIRID
jgi:tripartite-type tricarboxylate transporter receptor subunit TctC